MPPRKGRRTALVTALVTVVAVIVVAGALVWLGREHVRFFLAFDSLGPNSQGYTEYCHRQTGIVFVSLPGGTFLMGSPEDEEGGRQENEAPVHEVTLSPFMIAKFEVTQAQWRAVMGYNPSRFRGEDRPVSNVSWEECRAFCDRVELLLPTEAQWEYACRGGRASDPQKRVEIAWKRSSIPEHVGGSEANGFGVFEMHGNVAEWCEDCYQSDFYESAAATDPVCQDSSTGLRVLRDVGWLRSGRLRRCGYRAGYEPTRESNHTGFRAAYRWP